MLFTMAIWVHFLLLIAGLLNFASAVPVDQYDARPFINITTTSASSPHDMSMASSNHALKSTDSIQILYGQWLEKYHFWFVYQGPQGVAVNPCATDGLFHLEFQTPTYGPPVEQPPYLSKDAKWPVRVGSWRDCFIFGEDGHAGQLRCGDYLIVDLVKDPQFNDANFRCDYIVFHRAWMLEY